MHRAIEIVPAVKFLRLQHVGWWDSLEIEFVRGLNVIMSEGHAPSGVLILRAIQWALNPTSSQSAGLSQMGVPHGNISVELFEPQWGVTLTPHVHEPDIEEERDHEGFDMYHLLKNSLRRADQRMALLMTHEILGRMCADNHACALELLQAAPCQVIYLARNGYDFESLPLAQVYISRLDPHGSVEVSPWRVV